MERPSGTVTLLFTDIVGSTQLWETQPEAMAVALARHQEVVRAAVEDADGFVFKTVGDAFCAAFWRPGDGVRAAIGAQRALAAETWPESVVVRVRMGLHTGVCEERDGDYYGPTVNRTARLSAAAHGGQTVVSRATVEVVRDTLPDGVVLRDLGEHRLKDLGRPEHVFQIDAEGLGTEFPPLRSLDNRALRNNLPIQLTSFIGREQELADVRGLVARSRLVTLTGAGGSGKTRLALQVAAELADETHDGVWIVDLAPLSEPELVAATVAAVLAVRDEPGRTVSETLIDVMVDSNLLVVLDNCEHLIDACATLADAVLRGCPGVQILATSREPLGIGGERVYRVPSMALPPESTAIAVAGTDLSRFEAVRLFLERARDHRPDFVLDDTVAATVVSVCRRLDGIPLAIELAAARLRSMSIVDIAGRLDNRFHLLAGGSRTALARHQTLRALIDWSYDLLDDKERVVLRRLSVFSGGCDLDAAEAVCVTGEGEDVAVADILGSLVDKSLVQADITVGPVRYQLLETIRQYAAERLEHGETEGRSARRAHALLYLAFAETAGPHLAGVDQPRWFDRVEVELDNIRIAVSSFLSGDDPRGALRIAVALWDFWYCNYRFEGIEILDRGLMAVATDLSPLRATALLVCGYLRLDRGEYEISQAHFESALRRPTSPSRLPCATATPS